MPKIKVEVVGGIMVYCDHENYPTNIKCQKKGFGAAVGIQPKKVPFFPHTKFEELRNLLRLKTVVALGEIGLDRCAPAFTWKLQEEILVKVLQLSMPIRSVILHMRDAAGQHCGEVGARCLQIMKANFVLTQRIHLHCFTGTVEQVVSWLETFPKCYFGLPVWSESSTVSRRRHFGEFQGAMCSSKQMHLTSDHCRQVRVPQRSLERSPWRLAE
ncbi:hypothetical protein DPMN_052197 [Dreissena polymorpha]|uniref:Uncharacterized protein n=1 Tax=Dreissena polymorpha TaxID=45954 RepID=A0A9D4CL98_DREPO|nr:hypothetical protein DPMN_052197 [Dreissena polymorpha]